MSHSIRVDKNGDQIHTWWKGEVINAEPVTGNLIIDTRRNIRSGAKVIPFVRSDNGRRVLMHLFDFQKVSNKLNGNVLEEDKIGSWEWCSKYKHTFIRAKINKGKELIAHIDRRNKQSTYSYNYGNYEYKTKDIVLPDSFQGIVEPVSVIDRYRGRSLIYVKIITTKEENLVGLEMIMGIPDFFNMVTKEMKSTDHGAGKGQFAGEFKFSYGKCRYVSMSPVLA